MPFLEIAFAAEVSRFEDQDFAELARRICNEDPDTRSKKIEELRSLIYGVALNFNLPQLNLVHTEENICTHILKKWCPDDHMQDSERGECNPRRIDDAYLLRFLRCRRFIPALAHKLMVRYEQFRRDYAYLYDCDAFGLQKVKNVYGGTLPESPSNGRIILMRFGRWDADEIPIADVVRCALLMDEVAVMQPKMQILGVTIIVDLEGLGLRHLRQLTPAVAHQIVSLMGVSFPLPMHGLHVVNYSWFMNKFFYLFKQFIPKAVWSHLYFHADMASLHRHIDPEYLPPEYGGYSRHVITTEQWIAKIDQYKDDFLVHELRDLGFTVSSWH